MSVPRLVVAAPSSGSGKTTVATGLMAAWRSQGLAVSPHKVGPDYIDPGYHSLATGRPGRNLDPVLVGEERVAPLFLHGAAGADVAVVEGVMGLFDGRGSTGFGSTAHVARLLQAPVVLVVDASSMSSSIAALVKGFSDFDGRVRLGGIVLNRVGSERHEQLLREALDGLAPVLGVLRRDLEVATPSRHLGLVPAAERAPEATASVARLARVCAETLDLPALLNLARSAPALPGTAWDPAEALPVRSGQGDARPVVAVASGAAFTFGYAETTELLEAAGAEVVGFDPLRDEQLPERTRGLVIGGGFPEVFAEQLSANRPLRLQVKAFAESGGPVAAECAGLLYLCQELDGKPMCGVLPASGRMTPRLTLGYREADPAGPDWLGRERLAAHEFHRTVVEPKGGSSPAWGDGQGFAAARLHASYLHLHWAGSPAIAGRFVAACR